MPKKKLIVVIEDEPDQLKWLRGKVKKEAWHKKFKWQFCESMDFETFDKLSTADYVILDLNVLMFMGARSGLYAYALQVLDTFENAVVLMYSAMGAVVPDVIEEIEGYIKEHGRFVHALRLDERFDPTAWYENYISKYEDKHNA